MTDRTPMEKVKGIAIELVTLKARLPEPYRSNVEQCIKWCHDLEDVLTPTEIDDQEKDENNIVLELPYALATRLELRYGTGKKRYSNSERADMIEQALDDYEATQEQDDGTA